MGLDRSEVSQWPRERLIVAADKRKTELSRVEREYQDEYRMYERDKRKCPGAYIPGPGETYRDVRPYILNQLEDRINELESEISFLGELIKIKST